MNHRKAASNAIPSLKRIWKMLVSLNRLLKTARLITTKRMEQDIQLQIFLNQQMSQRPKASKMVSQL